MKKITKIVILTLIVALLGALTAVAVGAASPDADVSLNIKACNLSFSGSVHIVYAVEFENVDESDVKMLYWTSPQENEDDYTVDNAEKIGTGYTGTVNGVTCRIFENEQLWAKNMTDTLYARAYAKVNGVDYYSDVERYSILEYAYNKLGITGTETTNANLKTLLNQLLIYGEKIQKYFDYNTESLPTDEFVKIEVVGGILPDGMDYGLYKVGTVLNVRGITNPDLPIITWTDKNGNFIGDAANIQIVAGSENMVYTCTNTLPLGVMYELCEDGASYRVVSYNDTDPTVVIDADHKGLPVVEIADSAFRGRTDITGIQLPNTIKRIGDQAFRGCTALSGLDLPDSLTSIGIYAFAGCTSIDGISIPAATAQIGDRAFVGCSELNYINVDSGNPTYTSVDNCLIHVNDKAVVLGCNASVIPSDGSVNTIKAYAFSNLPRLTSITISPSISTISSEAFYHCDGITSVHIPYTVKNVSPAAFYMCSGISSITADSSTTASYYAINNCLVRKGTTKLVMGCKTSVIPTDGSIAYIYDRAFEGCDIKSVVIPSSVVIIGEGAFRNCDELSSLSFAEDSILDKIETGAFAGCSALASVDLPESLASIGESAFASASLTVLRIPSAVKTIGASAFMDCRAMTSVSIDSIILSDIGAFIFAGCDKLSELVIPNDCVISDIPAFALANCSPLEALHIPKKVNEIDDSAFVGCNSIQQITVGLSNADYFANGNCLVDRYNSTVILGCENSVIPDTAAVTAIGNRAFANKKITSVVIPSGIISIGDEAFKGCEYLTSVTLPDTLDHFGNGVFDGCVALVTTTSSGVEYVGSSTNPYLVLLKVSDAALTSVEVNADCEFIHSEAFRDLTSLTEINISGNIRKIGRYAFLGCDSIERVNLDCELIYWTAVDMSEPFSSPLTYSGAIYADGEKYEGIIAGGTETLIINHSFFWSKSYGGCRYVGNINNPYAILVRVTARGLDTYEIHPDTKIIFSEAFRNCQAMTDIVIPDSVVVIADDAFEGCESLSSVEISDTSSLATIGNSAFMGLTELSSINIPSSLKYIGDDAFTGCSSLSALEIPADNGISYIGARVFMGNGNLSSVNLPEATYIGDSAFKGSSVSNITIPKVKTIANDAFANCSSLREVVGYSGGSLIEHIGERAFMDSSVESIDLPRVTAIGDDAFNGCTALININIPEDSQSLKTVGDRAFYNCSSLTAINYGSAESIGVDILKGAKALTSMIIPFVGDGKDNPFFVYVFGGTSINDGYVTAFVYNENGTQKYDANNNPVVEENSNYELLPRTLASVVIRGGDEIKSQAFRGVFNGGEENHKTINKDVAKTTVTIPATVEVIGGSAFYQCRRNLGAVVIEEGSQLKTISASAFCNCFGMTSINLPEGLERIEGSAIRNTSITSITIPSTVTYIAAYGIRSDSLQEAVFADPTGWSIGGEATDSALLSDKSTAALYLRSTYQKLVWTKETE